MYLSVFTFTAGGTSFVLQRSKKIVDMLGLHVHTWCVDMFPELLGGLLADAVNTLKLSDVVGLHESARMVYTASPDAHPLIESETVVCVWLTDVVYLEERTGKKRKKDPPQGKSSSWDPSWQDPSWQDRNWQGWDQNHAWSASANNSNRRWSQ
jgi:hypothetical protein